MIGKINSSIIANLESKISAKKECIKYASCFHNNTRLVIRFPGKSFRLIVSTKNNIKYEYVDNCWTNIQTIVMKNSIYYNNTLGGTANTAQYTNKLFVICP